MIHSRLRDRLMPDYTRGEEIFNMVSHIVGGGFGVIALVTCLLVSALKRDGWGVVSSAVYGSALIILYCVSSIYHGLRPGMGKRVMQVIDHCVIYFLIAGTYTPVLLCAIRVQSAAWGWGLFGVVWGLAAIAAVFTAIDLKKYAVLSMTCYIGMGWSIVLAANIAVQAIPLPGLIWLLAGGIAYTLGAVLYGLGKRHRYMHSVFHLFVVVGSILQFVAIIGYIL